MKAKTSKAIAIFLATLMAISCTACDTNNISDVDSKTDALIEATEEALEETSNSTITTSNESSTEVSSTTVTDETATDDSLTDMYNEQSPPSISSETITAEEALQIAELAYESLVNKDYANAVHYTNLDLFYYFATGEWGSEEIMTAELEAAEEEGEDVDIADFSALENLQFLNAEQLTDEELKEYNDLVPRIVEEEDIDTLDYPITGAYKVYVTYDGLEEMTSADAMEQPYLLIMNTRSGWKLDLFIDMAKELYAMVDEFEQQETVDSSNNSNSN